jgi:hypothetical protein
VRHKGDRGNIDFEIGFKIQNSGGSDSLEEQAAVVI